MLSIGGRVAAGEQQRRYRRATGNRQFHRDPRPHRVRRAGGNETPRDHSVLNSVRKDHHGDQRFSVSDYCDSTGRREASGNLSISTEAIRGMTCGDVSEDHGVRDACAGSEVMAAHNRGGAVARRV